MIDHFFSGAWKSTDSCLVFGSLVAILESLKGKCSAFDQK